MFYTHAKGKHRIVPRNQGDVQRKITRFRVICLNSTGSLWLVDEWMSENEIRRQCNHFFSCTHGSRETYTMHRGQIIVRNTNTFGGGTPQRCTTVYLVTTHEVHRNNWHRTENFETFCLGQSTTLYQAKKMIDAVLDEGNDGKDG
jgi:hypothetical protein